MGGRKEVDPDTGLYFVPFSKTLVLREVIAGERCTVTRSEIDTALQRYSNVSVVKLTRVSLRWKSTI